MSVSIRTVPTNAECRCVLADGRLLTITASRRPRGNRAEVKCSVPGAPAIAERMQEIVRLARLTESRFDSRDQVVLSMDIAPAAQERDWELAAVLADRLVRGVCLPPLSSLSPLPPLPPFQAAAAPLYVHGWSNAWHLGQLSGEPAAALERLHRLAPGCSAAIVGGAGDSAAGVLHLTHLGALSGHANPASSVSTVRAWFPLHSGGANDSLAWVEVSVFPLDVAAQPAAGVGAGEDAQADEEDTISAPGLDLSAQQDVRQTLSGARHFDGKGLGRWRSAVRFGQNKFQGASYQLALVMADRLARGREFVPRGRIIATGCSSAWHAGRVETVEGRDAKLALILRQAGPGDRVLLPKAWQADLPAGYASALRELGASLACIDRIGMI